MKVRANHGFRFAGEQYKVNDILDVSAETAKHLETCRFGTIIPGAEEEPLMDEHEKTEEPEESKPLEELTVKELRELAKAKEIEGYSQFNKEQLISALAEV